MSSPGIVIDDGSEVGSHRGGFGGIDFNSLILFGISGLVYVWLFALGPIWQLPGLLTTDLRLIKQGDSTAQPAPKWLSVHLEASGCAQQT